MKALPEHGACFVCGSTNPKSIGARWFLREDGAVVAEVVLTAEQQGPPGHAHGGASAALLDEAMGAAVWQAGHMALAVQLNVEYRLPVPLGLPLHVTGMIARTEGRRVHTRGEIRLPGGEAAVVANGIFVEAREKITAFAREHLSDAPRAFGSEETAER